MTVGVSPQQGAAYVTRRRPIATSTCGRSGRGRSAVKLAEAKKTQLRNDALQGAGSDRMVGLKIAEVYDGLDLIVLPSDGARASIRSISAGPCGSSDEGSRRRRAASREGPMNTSPPWSSDLLGVFHFSRTRPVRPRWASAPSSGAPFGATACGSRLCPRAPRISSPPHQRLDTLDTRLLNIDMTSQSRDGHSRRPAVQDHRRQRHQPRRHPLLPHRSGQGAGDRAVRRHHRLRGEGQGRAHHRPQPAARHLRRAQDRGVLRRRQARPESGERQAGLNKILGPTASWSSASPPRTTASTPPTSAPSRTRRSPTSSPSRTSRRPRRRRRST